MATRTVVLDDLRAMYKHNCPYINRLKRVSKDLASCELESLAAGLAEIHVNGCPPTHDSNKTPTKTWASWVKDTHR